MHAGKNFAGLQGASIVVAVDIAQCACFVMNYVRPAEGHERNEEAPPRR